MISSIWLKALRSLLISVLLAAFAAGAGAQTLTNPTGTASEAEKPPAPAPDPLGRETPQGLVTGLISAIGDGDFERAVRFFETDTVRASVDSSASSGANLAHEVETVLNRAGSVISPELSIDPAGDLNDGLADDLDKIGTITLPGSDPEPLLAKRVERDGKAVWLVSAETLHTIHDTARASAADSLQSSLIDRFPAGPSLFGAPLSHWAALIVVVAISFAIAWILTAARGLFVWLVRHRYGETRLTRFVNASAAPIRVIITAIVFAVVIHAMDVSVVARYHATFAAQIVIWFAFAWLLWRASDAGGDFALSRMTQSGRLTAYSAVSFVKRAFKVLLGVVFVAAVLNAFGVNVTAGLAALGIGGLAIALGAQKLFENLIGSLTLIADRPVRIGDFCKFGDSLGTVEDIGIRSTRIRTLDRTVVTVPNGEFSAMQIENYTQRDQFLFRHTLTLRYETSPDQLRYLLQELRAMLYAHTKVDPNPARVRFLSLGAHSLDLEIFAYVRASDYADFLEVQEDLLLRAMDIVEASGSGFAFPSQTLYLGRDGGLDDDKRAAAEAVVKERLEKGELQVPRFTPEEISRLRGQIDYPPRGAAVGQKGPADSAPGRSATNPVCGSTRATYMVSSRGCAARQETNSRGLIDLKGAVPDQARGPGHTAPTYVSRFPGSISPTAEAATRFDSVRSTHPEETSGRHARYRRPPRPSCVRSGLARRAEMTEEERRGGSERRRGAHPPADAAAARPSRSSGRCAARSIRAASSTDIDAAGGTVAMPVVEKRHMFFRAFTGEDCLEDGVFGTRHPDAGAAGRRSRPHRRAACRLRPARRAHRLRRRPLRQRHRRPEGARPRGARGGHRLRLPGGGGRAGGAARRGARHDRHRARADRRVDRDGGRVRLLFLGDVVGRSGRKVVTTLLPGLIEKHGFDFVVVNGENAAGGFGITDATFQRDRRRRRRLRDHRQPRLGPARGALLRRPRGALPAPGQLSARHAGPRRQSLYGEERRARARGQRHGRRLHAGARRAVPGGDARARPPAPSAMAATRSSSTCTPRHRARSRPWAISSTARRRWSSARIRMCRRPMRASCPAARPS